MRKALIGMILAATVMTPFAAEAQNGREHDGNRGGGGHHQDNSNQNGGNGESRAARIEERQAQSQDQQAQPQPQQQPQQQQVVVRQHDGGGNGGNGGDRGNWRGNNDGNGNRGGNDGRRERTNQGSIYPQAWQGNPNDPQLRHYQELERRNQQRYDGNRRDDRDGRNWRNDRNDRNGRDTRNNRNWRNDWNRGWRNDRRYDWNNWRGRNRNVFHVSPYYSPYRNWRYQRFSIGFFLEPLFFDQRYWIGDPWQYRLPPAPYGTQWVRYYDDVLLVDIYTGEVVDTIYDFFW
jgi:hypothetical protein